MADQRIRIGAVLLTVALGCLVSSSQGVTLNMQNQCPSTITVYWQNGNQSMPTTASVSSQSTEPVDMGASWSAGVVWGGNSNRGLSSVAEFTIVENGQDTYDISLVDAYNIGIEIQPVTPSGDLCDDIKCTIAGLQGFCDQGTDNVYTPATGDNSESCKNTDGPQPMGNPPCCCATNNTRIFKGACPDAFSFSTENQSSQFYCVNLTDYNIIFCPAGNSSDHGLPPCA